MQQWTNLPNETRAASYLCCRVWVVVKPGSDNSESDAWFSDWVEVAAVHRHLRTAAEHVNRKMCTIHNAEISLHNGVHLFIDSIRKM